MLLSAARRHALALSQRSAAGFSLLELSLSLALGLVVLSLAVNAVVIAQHQWLGQRRGWQALLAMRFITTYLTEELHQAAPALCPNVQASMPPVVVSAPLPAVLDAQQLRYVHCVGSTLVPISVRLRHHTLYRQQGSDKALQLLTEVTHFSVTVERVDLRAVLVHLEIAVQGAERWPLDVLVRGI